MNLIPFALSLDTNLLVDVADVQSGKECGCICPSCNIPLIARKGDINKWHFAHDSQFIEKDQELSCDFSWAVAVKMMIKQILLEGSTLELPEYFIDFKEIGYQQNKYKIKVTDRSTIHYANPELKSLACDVTVEVKGKKLGIILLNRDSQPFIKASFDQTLFGVLAISIESVGYDDEGKVINHLRKHLQLLLESKTSAKHWLYHRRQESVYLEATEQEKFLRAMTTNEQKKASNATQTLQTMQWHCLSCQLEYQGYSTGLNSCPKCNSHFYRTPM